MFDVITDIDAEYPEGVTGIFDWRTGEFTEFKNVCDNCSEVMMLAWGKDCPICGWRMRRVYLGARKDLP